jgi:hypothetical protein
MGLIDWRMRGPEFGNCNCAWGCPCQFNALPTHGFCEAIAGMRIEAGHFGDIPLDGLNWVGTFQWPGPVHEGNGTQQFFIDERADARQREALAAILHGGETEPGTTYLQVFNSMVSTVLEPIYTRVELDIDVDSVRAHLSVPSFIEAVGRPMQNPFNGKDHRMRVSLEGGFEYREAEFASGSTRATGAIKLDFKDSHAHFVHSDLTQNGIHP